MYFIENSRLIECKNKALNNWSKHNFIFNKFSDLVIQKITELKKEFKDILIISADFDETISKITKLQFDNLFHFSQYKCFLEKISLNNKNWDDIHPEHLKLILKGYLSYNNGVLFRNLILEIFKNYKFII